jgi:hypothetical protein
VAHHADADHADCCHGVFLAVSEYLTLALRFQNASPAIDSATLVKTQAYGPLSTPMALSSPTSATRRSARHRRTAAG